MRIISFYNEPWEKEYLAKKVPGIVFMDGTAQSHPELAGDSAEAICVFVKCRVDATLMDRFPNLKLVVTRSTGFDHIDIAEASRRGIVVASAPFYGKNTVTEQAFGLLLSLSRKIYKSHSRVLRGGFSPEGLRGFDLKGKTIGVVGTGNIGAHAVRIAHGFEMNIIAYDVRENEDIKKEIPFRYVSFDELLATSDVITLHAPYNEHTHHMINLGNYEKIKRGAYLINTARGGLVETEALVMALEKGILAGAGLDVLEGEEFLTDRAALLMAPDADKQALRIALFNQYLVDHPNVVVTPHNAFNTKEAIERILDTTVENLLAFEAGAPVNVVVQKQKS